MNKVKRFFKRNLAFKLLYIVIIVALLGKITSNILTNHYFDTRIYIKTFLAKNGIISRYELADEDRMGPNPTQTPLQRSDNYPNRNDWINNPEKKEINTSAVCRDIKTYTATTFESVLTDPEHACSIVISSDQELSLLATLSQRLINLKILKVKDLKNTRIPPEIGNIQSLRKLQIENTKNTILPPEIGKLSDLIELTIYKAHLAELPHEIGNLKHLEKLNVSNNKELQAIPPEIGKLYYLWELILNNDSLTTLPDELQSGNIIALDLTGNNISQFPPVITKLKQLSFLTLDYNQLESLPNSINDPEAFPNLLTLEINHNKLISFPEINKDIVSLQLRGNKLSNLPSLVDASYLTTLDVTNNRLTNLPQSFSQMKNLEFLYLGGNDLSTLPDLSKINLKELSISFNLFSSLPSKLPWNKLDWIDIKGNSIPQEQIIRFTKLFPNTVIEN